MTEREFWGLDPDRGDGDRMLGLLPATQGALKVGILRGEVTGQWHGWNLFAGVGPGMEFWEGTEADYAETGRIVRAVVEGGYRSWWTRRESRGLLSRRARVEWTQHAEFAVPGKPVHCSQAGAGILPEPGEPLECQAAPY